MQKSAAYLPTRASWPLELALMAAVGLFFGLAGLFNTSEAPLNYRLGYWLPVMMFGGIIVMLSELAWNRLSALPLKSAAASFIAVTVIATSGECFVVALFDGPHDVTMPNYYYIGQLWLNVVIVMIPMVAMMRVLRIFLLRPRVTSESSVVSPDPSNQSIEIPSLISSRLRAPLRTSTLHAIQAEDHYIRIFTADGDDLIKMRFADALSSLQTYPGFRLHRSWWDAEAAIQGARFKNGRGQVSLTGNVTAPLSRTYAGELREAGWLG
ncbi:MAG: LytTR family DNA-binding domain-containing protein [Maricaulis sp.]|nr:LytTR family DNA-binding domain-containing protein [Maricaulis sp.]